MTADAIIRAVLTGPKSDLFFAVVEKHVKSAIDTFAGQNRRIVEISLGPDRYAKMREKGCQRIIGKSPALCD